MLNTKRKIERLIKRRNVDRKKEITNKRKE